jgi:hypothetical protein
MLKDSIRGGPLTPGRIPALRTAGDTAAMRRLAGERRRDIEITPCTNLSKSIAY